MAITQIEHKDIEALNTERLHLLLQILVENELAKHGIPSSCASINLQIYAADQASDGLVSWEGVPPYTDRIPKNRTLFQVKGGYFEPGKFKQEPFRIVDEQPYLKEAVAENLKHNGAYVFFCGGRTYVDTTKAKSIREVKQALKPYHPSSDIEVRIYDSGDIAAWTNKFAPAIIRVLSWSQKNTLEAYLTWEGWNTFYRIPPDPKWVPNDQMNRIIKQIRDTFVQPQQVLRLVGQSGLGKSRLVMEAFRPPEDRASEPIQTALSSSIVYVVKSQDPEIMGTVAILAKSGVAGIIVVDDCDERTHIDLAAWVRFSESKLSLITMDYHVDEDLPEDGRVKLEQSDSTTISRMLEGVVSPQSGDLNLIIQYAEGFPKIAALVAALPPDDLMQLSGFVDKRLTERLVWGGKTESNDESRDIIGALSLFAYVGFKDPYEKHRIYVAQHVCKMDPEEFRRKAQVFIERGVLQPVGAFVRVSPIPIAVRLARSWIKRNGKERWLEIGADAKMPGDLRNAFASGLEELQGLEQAKDYAYELMEPSGPFGSAEVLSTEQGSRVFRALAKVSPEVALTTLIREFGGASLETLAALGDARHNLIWALQTIVFNRELFVPAASLLARFALTEDKKGYGGNARSSFKQLFNPMLSGTEAAPMERIEVLDKLFKAGNDAAVELALKSLSTAFSLNSATRSYGAERQQGKILKDWCPATWGDLFTYFEAALGHLTPYAVRNDHVGELARDGISHSIRPLVRLGRFDMIEYTLRAVESQYKKAWPEAFRDINDSLRYEKMTAADRAQVEGWLQLLQPSDFAERLRLIISTPPVGNLVKDDGGTWIDVNEIAARELAATLVYDYKKLLTAIPLVSSGEQRQGYTFGNAVGKLLSDAEINDFADRSFDELEKAAMNGNASMLCGFLAAIRPKQVALVDAILNRAAASEYASKSMTYLTAWTYPTEADLERLYGVLDSGKIEVDAFRALVLGAVLKDFSPAFVGRYFRRFLQYGTRGAYAALFIVSSYIRDEEQWSCCKSLIRRILGMRGMFETKSVDTMDAHFFEQGVKRLLSDPNEQVLARRLSREIVRICKMRDLGIYAYQLIQPVVFELLGKHCADSWPLFGAALVKANALTRFHLQHAMERNLAMRGAPKSALALVQDEVLLSWCEQYPNDAPAILLSLEPLFVVDKEEIVTIPSLVETVFERYGSDPDVRSAASGNLETFSITGSATPLYEERVKFMKLLIKNRNVDVAAWAAEYLTSLEGRLRNQRMRDEEHARGIYTPMFASEMPQDQLDDNIPS